MGFFSWITNDTNKSIANIHSGISTKPVYMLDDKGNVWIEDEYEGYGVFGNKDYYELLAEMNEAGSNREIGIKLENGINAVRSRTSGKIYQGGNIDFFNWESDIIHNGLSANQLIKYPDWDSIKIDFKHLKYPNLVHKLRTWINEKPEICENQGYFY